MDEEQIIRDRLSVEERNLRRVTKKHANLLNALEQGNIKKDVRQHQFYDFMVDFSSYELTLTRFQAVHDMNLQETRHWNEEARRIEQEIEETMIVIKNLEKELAQEEEIRRNKTEYDKLAAQINGQKTRDESLSAIAKLDEEIISLDEKDRLLGETLDRRRSQLQRIVTVVQEVQNEIEIEKEQNPQVIGDEEEAVTTPDSMRSEFFSPIANPISPAERVNNNNSNLSEINGIDSMDSSSSNIVDNDNEGIRHRNNNDDKENKQQNNEESTPQQQSQDTNISDNATEVGEDVAEDTIEEIGELVADEVELEAREDVATDVETIDNTSSDADLNQNVEIEELDDDVVTSDHEKNNKYEDNNENDDVPVPTPTDGDDGEIMEDSDENQRGEKRKRSDEEDDDDEEEEEGLIKEKVPRLSDDDEGLIEESEEDEGVIINEQ